MKKYIIATFCSAVIVPGMGQVINGQIKKGLIHMGLVFIIVVAFVIKLTKVIMAILPGFDPEKINREAILAKIDITDYTVLRLFSIIFLALWVYSIIDAFIIGLKIEKGKDKQI
jgi:hypothetical protein